MDEYVDDPAPRVQPLAERLGPLANAAPVVAVPTLRRARASFVVNANAPPNSARPTSGPRTAWTPSTKPSRKRASTHLTEGGVVVHSTRGPSPPAGYFATGAAAAHLVHMHEVLDVGFSLSSTNAAGRYFLLWPIQLTIVPSGQTLTDIASLSFCTLQLG